MPHLFSIGFWNGSYFQAQILLKFSCLVNKNFLQKLSSRRLIDNKFTPVNADDVSGNPMCLGMTEEGNRTRHIFRSG